MDTQTDSTARYAPFGKRQALALAGAMAALAFVVAKLGALFPALVAGGALLWFFLREPRRFVFALAVYVPLEEFVLKWLPDTLYAPARYAGEGMLILVFAWMLARRAIRREPVWTATPLDLPLLAFLGVAAASAYTNDVPAFIAALGLKNIIRYALLFYIAAYAGFTAASRRRLVHVLLAVAFLESIAGIVQAAGGAEVIKFFKPADVAVGDMALREFDAGGGGVFATMGRYNILGNFLAFFIVMAMGVYTQAKGRARPALAVFFGAASAALVLTSSRMSWVGVYVGALLMLFVLKKRKALLAAAVAPAAAVLLLVLTYQGLYWYAGEKATASKVERLVSVFSSGYIEKSMRYDRLFALFVTAPAVLEKSPLLGLGPGAFASEVTGGGTQTRGMFPEYSNADALDIKNTEALQYTTDQGWVTILGQTGLLGLGCFVWLVAAMALRTRLLYRRAADPSDRGMALGFLCCLGLIVFQNFVSFNLTYRPVSLYLWLFAGLAVAAGREEGKGEDARG